MTMTRCIGTALAVGLLHVIAATWPRSAAAEAPPGLAVAGSRLVLPAELEFTKDIGKSAELRRLLAVSAAAVTAHDKDFAKGNQALDELRARLVQLNTQIASLPSGDIETHNRLVGTIHATSGQIDLLTSQRNKAEEKGRERRAAVNEAREAYLQFVLDMRKRAEAIEADYAAKAGDRDIQDAVASKSAADGKEYAFGPSPAFQAALRKLKTLEDAVLSETIQLEREGKVLRASVSVNGGKPQSMVVDSGSSTMLVPGRLAEEFDVVPTDYDQKVKCTLADGNEVEGTLKTLRSVRVGKFTVENVECVVLGPDAPAADVLLGMSFLGKFEFKLDPDAGTLEMARVGQ